MGRSNVIALESGVLSPEAVLRDALGDVIARRAAGQKPYAVVIVGDEDRLPLMAWSEASANDLAACATRVQIAAISVMQDAWDEGDGS